MSETHDEIVAKIKRNRKEKLRRAILRIVPRAMLEGAIDGYKYNVHDLTRTQLENLALPNWSDLEHEIFTYFLNDAKDD